MRIVKLKLLSNSIQYETNCYSCFCPFQSSPVHSEWIVPMLPRMGTHWSFQGRNCWEFEPKPKTCFVTNHKKYYLWLLTQLTQCLVVPWPVTDGASCLYRRPCGAEPSDLCFSSDFDFFKKIPERQIFFFYKTFENFPPVLSAPVRSSHSYSPVNGCWGLIVSKILCIVYKIPPKNAWSGPMSDFDLALHDWTYRVYTIWWDLLLFCSQLCWQKGTLVEQLCIGNQRMFQIGHERRLILHMIPEILELLCNYDIKFAGYVTRCLLRK